jgi:hypothetical protein
VPAPAPVTQAEQIHEAVPPEAASTADLHTEN